MTMILPFTPGRGATVTVAPNATNVNTDYSSSNNGEQMGSFLITNAGASICFVRIQNQAGAVAASAVDTPVLPNSSRILWFAYRSEPFRVSVFAPAATTVYITPGEGGM